jgi:hypothetical protein
MSSHNSFSQRTVPIWVAILILLISYIVPPGAMAQEPGPTSARVSPLQANPAGSQTSSRKNLDFSSVQASIAAVRAGTITLGGRLAADGRISGGTAVSILPGALLTPAMNAALWQTITGGQSLLLNLSGAATGGTARLNSSWAGSLSTLVVPAGVAVNAVGFNTSCPLAIAGSASISGSLYALQTSAGMTAQLNTGKDLIVGAGGLISGSLPAGFTGTDPGKLFASQHLILNVLGNFTNSGTVTVPGNLNINVGGALANTTANGSTAATLSAQNLNIFSGSGNVINSGLMSAVNNINITTKKANTDLNVNNAGGTLQALNAINLRDPLYEGSSNLNLTGGDWLSREINLYSGKGSVAVDVGNLTGTINTHAGCAHIGAVTPSLHLGILDVSGDPFVYNNGGDLDLASVTFPATYLVGTASGSIYTSSEGTAIDTSSATGNGGNVVLAAGVIATDTNGSITLERSFAGGDIMLRAGTTPLQNAGRSITGFDTSSSGSGFSGGNATLIAMSDCAGSNSGGHIFLPANLQMKNQGTGAGANGNVTIIAEASDQVDRTIEIGSLGSYSTVSGSGGGGYVTIKAATPLLSGATIADSTGAVAGSFEGGDLQNGKINLAGSIVSPAAVAIQGAAVMAANQVSGSAVTILSGSGASGDIVVSGAITGTNSVTLVAGGSISGATTAQITANSLTLQAAGDIGLANPLVTQVTYLTAGSTAGSVSIMNTGQLQSVTSTSSTSFTLTTTDTINVGTGGINSTGAVALSTQSSAATINLVAGSISSTAAVTLSVANAGSINIPDGQTITSPGCITLNTPQLVAQGTLSAGSVVMNSQAGGVIANPNGNVDLKDYGNVAFYGKTLAIVAKENIINTGKPVTIDLSGAAAQANLTLIAGYDSTHSADGSTYTLAPKAIMVTIGGSSSGNFIDLGNVNINTSATGSNNLAGNVLVVAGGLVNLGNVTATSNAINGKGGSFTVYGQSINVGTIKTTAFSPGSVSIRSAPAQQSGQLVITRGTITSGSFSPGATYTYGDVAVNSIDTGNADINIACGIRGKILQSPGSIISTGGTLSIGTGMQNQNLHVAAAKLSVNTRTAYQMGSVTIYDTVRGTLLTSKVGGNLTVIGENGIAVGAGQTITAGGNLTLSNKGAFAGVSIGDATGNACTLIAGSISTFASSNINNNPSLGLVSTDIVQAGSIIIQSSGSDAGNGISIGRNVQVSANGGGITLSASKPGANINALDKLSMIANGGSITVNNSVGTANLGVEDGTGTTLIARTLNGTTGGNINISGNAGIRIGGGAAVNALAAMSLSSLNGNISIAPGTGGTFSVVAGTTINAKGGVSFGGFTNFTSGKPMRVSATGSASGITLGDNVSITSGTAGGSTGALLLSAAGSGGISAGDHLSLVSTGGAMSITASLASAQIVMGSDTQLRAEGGSLNISGRDSVAIASGCITTNRVGTLAGAVTISGVDGLTIGNKTETTQISSASSMTLTNGGSLASRFQLGNNVKLISATALTLKNANTTSNMLIGDNLEMKASAGAISISASPGIGPGLSIGAGATLTATGVAGIKISIPSPIIVGDKYTFTASSGPITIASTWAGGSDLSIGAANGDPLSSMTAAGAIALTATSHLNLGSGKMCANGSTFAAISKNGTATVSATFISARTAAAITGYNVRVGENAIVGAGTAASISGTRTVSVDSGACVSADTIATISGGKAVTLDTGACVIGLTGVTIKTSGTPDYPIPTLTIGTGVNLTAGSLASGSPAAGVLAPGSIATPACLVLSAATVNIGGAGAAPDGNTFTSNGNDLKITATAGPLTINSGNTFQANGGNIQLLAKGVLDAGSQNTFYARAAITSITTSAGGGIELEVIAARA